MNRQNVKAMSPEQDNYIFSAIWQNIRDNYHRHYKAADGLIIGSF